MKFNRDINMDKLQAFRQEIIAELEHFAAILDEMGYTKAEAKVQLDKLSQSALNGIYA